MTPTRAPFSTARSSGTAGVVAVELRHSDGRRGAGRDEPGAVGAALGRRAEPVERENGAAVAGDDEQDPVDRAAQRVPLGGRVGQDGERAVDRQTRAGLVVRAELARDRPGAQPERDEPRHDRERRQHRPRRPWGPVEREGRQRLDDPLRACCRGLGRRDARRERGELRLDRLGRRPEGHQGCRGARHGGDDSLRHGRIRPARTVRTPL